MRVTGWVVVGVASVSLTSCDLGQQTVSEKDLRVCPMASTAAPLGRFDATTLEGDRLDQARDTAASHGCAIRVVERNGKPLFVTADLNRGRINVVIVEGVIQQVVDIG